MIDCLTNSDRMTRSQDILEMHRLRCRVFKGRLDWDVEVRDGLECDRFDCLDPIYLLAFDDNERLVGTWRMLPTTGPYMLRDIFPQLLGDMPAPCDARTWEGSRFAIDAAAAARGLRDRDGLSAVSRVTSEIFCAVVELCMAFGVEEVVTVYDARIARLLPRIGCEPTWRSEAHRIGKTITMAGRFEISDRVLARIRERGGIEGSVLRHAPMLKRRADVLTLPTRPQVAPRPIPSTDPRRQAA